MKNLFLIILLAIFSFNARAEFMGGVIKTKGGKALAIACVEKFDSGACSEINIMIKNYKSEQFEVMQTIFLDQVNVNEVSHQAAREANEELDESYAAAALIGSVAGIAVGWSNASSLMVPAIIVGAAVDVVKAPIVGIFYLAHKGSDIFKKRKMKRCIKFMLNSKKRGKSLRTRDRYFESLALAF